MKTPYRHADKAVKKLVGSMGGEFQNLSVSVPFDELNVIRARKEVNGTFSRISREVKREFREVSRKVRTDTEEEIGAKSKRFDSALFLLALFKRYDPVTKYVYNTEWTRKRDRTVEGMLASRNRLEMRNSLRRSLDVLVNQVKQYADNLTDEARLSVFRDAGIQYVIWNTQEDEKVCEICRERDGKRYAIGDIPPKHYHCRCYLTASIK